MFTIQMKEANDQPVSLEAMFTMHTGIPDVEGFVITKMYLPKFFFFLSGQLFRTQAEKFLVFW